VPLRSVPWVQVFSSFRQLALLKQVFSQSENTRTHKRALIDRKGIARDYFDFSTFADFGLLVERKAAFGPFFCIWC
ncbi:MAG TPA: hypothetical protein DCW94_03320, partial [Porticoccaceae bacterium]|nr:hypothetical protein [Porticoccaceae bacterium]